MNAGQRRIGVISIGALGLLGDPNRAIALDIGMTAHRTDSGQSRQLIEKWSRLHTVRTALGFAATIIFLWASLRLAKLVGFETASEALRTVSAISTIPALLFSTTQTAGNCDVAGQRSKKNPAGKRGRRNTRVSTSRYQREGTRRRG